MTIDDLMAWISDGLAESGRGGSRTAPTEGADSLAGAFHESPVLSHEEARRVETDFKYEGYLQQQEKQMERMKRSESRRIPEWFEYAKVSGLSREVVEKLTKVRPLTLGQASRIPASRLPPSPWSIATSKSSSGGNRRVSNATHHSGIAGKSARAKAGLEGEQTFGIGVGNAHWQGVAPLFARARLRRGTAKGSHLILKHPRRRMLILPVHRGIFRADCSCAS